METEIKNFKIEKAYKDNNNIYLVLSNTNLMDNEEKRKIVNSDNLVISELGFSYIAKEENNVEG